MIQLINNMIFIASDGEDRQKKYLPLTELSQEIPRILAQLEPQAKRQGLRLSSHLAANLRPVQIDPAHLTTILQELIGNSIKYTEYGGTVSVTAEMQEEQGNEGGFVIIEVSDTGIGIKPENQRGIFDEFYRANSTEETHSGAGGLGVGLAIVRALIEAYSGRIWLQSEDGQGSRFSFVLPVLQKNESILTLSAIGST